jgi:hypothetical protein
MKILYFILFFTCIPYLCSCSYNKFGFEGKLKFGVDWSGSGINVIQTEVWFGGEKGELFVEEKDYEEIPDLDAATNTTPDGL